MKRLIAATIAVAALGGGAYADTDTSSNVKLDTTAARDLTPQTPTATAAGIWDLARYSPSDPALTVYVPANSTVRALIETTVVPGPNGGDPTAAEEGVTDLAIDGVPQWGPWEQELLGTGPGVNGGIAGLNLGTLPAGEHTFRLYTGMSSPDPNAAATYPIVFTERFLEVQIER